MSAFAAAAALRAGVPADMPTGAARRAPPVEGAAGALPACSGRNASIRSSAISKPPRASGAKSRSRRARMAIW